MLSELTQAEIINGAVLVVTLHGDLGRHRKIGPVRLLRPVVVAAGIVPLFIDPLVTHGAGLAVERRVPPPGCWAAWPPSR
jgi:hypothetical protein